MRPRAPGQPLQASRASVLRRAAAALVASLALAGGAFLALHHPIWPWACLAFFALWCAAAARFEGVWLFVLPACLPMANFAPWTGWIVFEEFDLVAIGALAAGYARIAVGGERLPVSDRPSPPPRAWLAWSLLFAASAALALWRGLSADADASPGFDWYAGHADPLNALRVGKAVLYAALLLPVLRRVLRHPTLDATGRFAAGMLVGTAIVVAAAIWERAAYPGLLNYSQSYRTVALFWEMHVGGAAIDGYLAMAVPFVALAAQRAGTPLRWLGAALLALLVEYACLTTFSRGVYLAVCCSLVVLGVLAARQKRMHARTPWLRPARAALVVAMLAQAAMVFGSDSFMLARMKSAPLDFGNRLAHWHHGLQLLKGPTDWWLGIGLGRLPRAYAASVPEQGFSGEVHLLADSGDTWLRLSGPRHDAALAGLYALTQRIAIEPTPHRAAFDVRAHKIVRVSLSVCESHLLYEFRCQRGVLRVNPGGGAWQRVTLPLQGAPLPSDGWPPRMAVFAITVLDADSHVELRDIVLSSAGGANLLRNADFSDGLARWFPVAKDYFMPWHIDNLYLELLIEQGLIGLGAFAGLVVCAFAALLSPRSRGLPYTPFLAASLVAMLILGLVSSLLDVARLGFALTFIAWLSIQLGEVPEASCAT